MMMESRFWGDPANCVDELRKRNEAEKVRKECRRFKKQRRIRMLVKNAKQGRK